MQSWRLYLKLKKKKYIIKIVFTFSHSAFGIGSPSALQYKYNSVNCSIETSEVVAL